MQSMLRWKLGEFLESRGITGYRLIQESDVSHNTIYKLINNQTDGVQGRVLNEILTALHRLTGEDVTPNDLLEFKPGEDNA